jgi:hypothetical protein
MLSRKSRRQHEVPTCWPLRLSTYSIDASQARGNRWWGSFRWSGTRAGHLSLSSPRLILLSRLIPTALIRSRPHSSSSASSSPSPSLSTLSGPEDLIWSLLNGLVRPRDILVGRRLEIMEGSFLVSYFSPLIISSDVMIDHAILICR